MSELENGRKASPHPDVLKKLLGILNVGEAFARGEIPCYHDDPVAARGLAAGIVPAVDRDRERLAALRVNARVSQILRMVVSSGGFTPVELAYVLQLSGRSLSDMIDGTLAIPDPQIKALSEITTIPLAFLLEGKGAVRGAPLEDFLPAIDLARSAGLTGTDLYRLVSDRIAGREGTGNAVPLQPGN